MQDTGRLIFRVYTSDADIPVEGATVLIRQQEQIKILFFVFCNFYNSHQSHLQIPIYLIDTVHSSPETKY